MASSGANKLEREKLKLVQEKCLSCLDKLLRDDDNKYCVDCDAKGPRWASWNLGIFLCIRCAGIHRNLGVHISKVKSINLDSWTPEQVGYLQQMGNSKARAIYEANLPDAFRRPQTDSSLEAFVRAKYEQKKYIAKEWTQPPTPPPAFDIEEERRKDKEKKKNRSAAIGGVVKSGNSSAPVLDVQNNSVPRPQSSPASTIISADKVPKDLPSSSAAANKGTSDLLGLSFGSPTELSPSSVATTPQQQVAPSNNNDDDLFDAFVSADVTKVNNNARLPSGVQPANAQSNATNSSPDEEADFFNQKAPVDNKMDLASILKLYDNASVTANSLFATHAAPATSVASAGGPFGPFGAPAPVQQNGFANNGHGLFGPPAANGGVDLFNQASLPSSGNSATNPFLTSNTSSAQNFNLISDQQHQALGGGCGQNGTSSLHHQFGGLQLNNQMTAVSNPQHQVPAASSGLSDWNWAAPGTGGVAPTVASALSSTSLLGAFGSGVAQPTAPHPVLSQMASTAGGAFANPFMTSGPGLVSAVGGPADFADFGHSNTGLGATAANSSSLDTLNWGFSSTTAGAPAATASSNNLWQ